MKFGFAIIAIAIGYAVMYYGLYMMWKYNPNAPGTTNAPGFLLLLGKVPDMLKDHWAEPPFTW